MHVLRTVTCMRGEKNRGELCCVGAEVWGSVWIGARVGRKAVFEEILSLPRVHVLGKSV